MKSYLIKLLITLTSAIIVVELSHSLERVIRIEMVCIYMLLIYTYLSED